MRRTTVTHAVAAVAVAAVAMFGLSGCTGSPQASTATSSSTTAPGTTAPSTPGNSASPDDPGDSGQSKAAACDIIQKSIATATGQFDSVGEGDPGAVVETMKAAAEELSNAASQVTNDEVSALIPPLRDMFTQAADIMQAVVDGDASKLTDLNDLGTQFQQTLATFQETCAP